MDELLLDTYFDLDGSDSHLPCQIWSRVARRVTVMTGSHTSESQVRERVLFLLHGIGGSREDRSRRTFEETGEYPATSDDDDEHDNDDNHEDDEGQQHELIPTSRVGGAS